MPALTFLAIQELTPAGVWGALVAAVVGQIVVGSLFLIGFVAIVRRFMDKEVPAQLSSVNQSLRDVHNDLERLARELIEMRREVDKHGYRIQTLDDWRKDVTHGPRGGSQT